MKTFTEGELRNAVRTLEMPDDMAEHLLAVIQNVRAGSSSARFEAAHVAYYLGSLLIIGAMGWFVTDAWDRLSGIALTAIALTYAAVFGTVGRVLWSKPALRVPGGLLSVVAVCMTPLAVYGIERHAGWWPQNDPGGYVNFHPYINGSWVGMEAATIVIAAIALRYIRFPFLTAPAVWALWYMSMDATSILFRRTWSFHDECWISIAFGLVMLMIGYFADGKREGDFSFWFYFFGLLTFSGGLSLLGDGSQVGRAIYGLIHFGLIVLSILLQRRAFLIIGGIGVFAYLAEEATNYFKDSFSFTLALTLIGILFLVVGVLYTRHEGRLREAFMPWMPERIRRRHMPAAQEELRRFYS